MIQQFASALKADLSAGCPAGRLYGESFGAALAVHLLTTCSRLKQNIQTYSDGLPKHKQQIVEDVVAEGDKVVFRSTLKGTHTGNFMGIPPTGKWVNTSGNFNLLRIAEGKIVEWWYEANLLEVMKQLGALS